MKKQSTLSVTATATEGQWLYKRDALLKIREFRDSHIGVDVTIRFEAHDDPEYWQYKYLFGYVYYAIAVGNGMSLPEHIKEGDDIGNKGDIGIDRIDRELKEEFLFKAVSEEMEIPRKWLKNCQKLSVEYKDQETGETKKRLYGVIPSKTVIGYEGLKAYIIKCEYVRDGITDWKYANPAEMERVRALAFGEGAKEI